MDSPKPRFRLMRLTPKGVVCKSVMLKGYSLAMLQISPNR